METTFNENTEGGFSLQTETDLFLARTGQIFVISCGH